MFDDLLNLAESTDQGGKSLKTKILKTQTPDLENIDIEVPKLRGTRNQELSSIQTRANKSGANGHNRSKYGHHRTRDKDKSHYLHTGKTTKRQGLSSVLNSERKHVPSN
jgi:hypothetical protein